MFTILPTMAISLITINASAHYLSWQNVESADAQTTLRTHRISNTVLAVSICGLGSGMAVTLAYKLQNPTPLILTAMGIRIVACASIALATLLSGEVVNRWCFQQLG